ncbi:MULTISPECIES: hypothetical protein [Burkholderiaceae]|nr:MULTISPECIES: hypothetical protein [Burkholderiaceae]
MGWAFPFVLSGRGPWRVDSDDALLSDLRLYSSDGRFTGVDGHVLE